MSWYIAERVVYEKFTGHVTVDEVRELLQKGEKFQEEAGDKALHYIADITELQSLPLNIVKLRNIELKRPAQRGMTVVVSSPNYSVNSVATFFGKLMRTVFGLRFKMLPSLEAAYAHLQELDASLKPVPDKKPDVVETQPVPDKKLDVTATQPVSEDEAVDTKPFADKKPDVTATQPVSEDEAVDTKPLQPALSKNDKNAAGKESHT
jgi:hypothetical protein